MKKLNCRLIVSDFDGTLANSENQVPESVVNAINAFVKDGGIFAVCTGRILPSVLPRARGMGLKGLVVACQGSVIAEIETGKIIRNVCFAPAEAAEICRTVEELNENVQLYFGDGFYSSLPADEKHLNYYESIIGVTALHSDLPLSEVAAGGKKAFNKVAVLCRPESQAELFKKLAARLGSKFDVTCSAKVLIEIAPLGETKGAAVEFLCAHYGVPVESCCAVGDNLNDITMIERAGVGVAVGNAEKELKEVADYITVTNDEGAVAAVIEKFGYKEV